MKALKKIMLNRALALAVLNVFMFLLFSLFFGERYFSLTNIGIILLNMSAEAFVLVAMSILLFLGQIDLSLGSSMVMAAMICGRFMLFYHIPMGWVILIVVCVGFVTGVINGLIVSFLKIAPFIVTLATSMIIMGIAVMLAGSGWSDFQNELFHAMGSAKVFGFIQLPVIYAVVLFTIFAYLTTKNRFFRNVYFIGGNEKAAELSGLNIKLTKILVFAFAAVLAALAGVVSAMRFNTAMTSIGTGVELRAVTAAVIGGVAFTGGKGTIPGAAMGALLIASLNNVLMMFKLSPDLQFAVTGIVLVLTILLDSLISGSLRKTPAPRRDKI